MRLTTKVENVVRRLKQSWGSAETKRELWNREFGSGRWDFCDNTEGDVIYGLIGKYSRNGSILELGCGSGNTACELDASAYSEYTGVDISDNALEKAAARSKKAGRASKNRYIQGDIVAYVPDGKFDVILFRESIYYVPPYKITAVLRRYSESLAPQGVILVRWHDASKGSEFLSLLRSDFEVAEFSPGGGNEPFMVAFRPRARNTQVA
jgi:SAM-dependent methyltransferase